MPTVRQPRLRERARALEQRRDELLEELEKVRTTLTKLEGSLQEKRDSLDLTQLPNTSVRGGAHSTDG